MKSIGINLDIRAGASVHMNMRPPEVWDQGGGVEKRGKPRGREGGRGERRKGREEKRETGREGRRESYD